MTEKNAEDSAGRRSRFVATILSGYGLIAVSLLVNLWLTPFVLRFVTREEYGIWVLALDLIVWLGVFDLGLTTGLAVRLARLRGSGDDEEMSRLASTAFVAQCVIGVAVVGIGVLVSRWFPGFFDVGAESRADAAFVVFAVIVGLGISLPSQTHSAILVAWQKGATDNLIRFTNFAVRITLTVALLVNGSGLRSLGIAHLVASLVSAVVLVIATRRLAPVVSVRPSRARMDAFGRLAELGAWLSVGNLATIAIRGLDRAVAGRVVSLESVAILELTGRAYQPGINATGHFVSAAEPVLGEIVGSGDVGGVIAVYRRLFLVSVSVTTTLAAALFAANGTFVFWWVGGENYGGAALDALLAVNMVLNFVVWSHKNLLTVSLVARPAATTRVLEGMLNLGLSVMLAYRYGITGIVAATTIATLATSIWMMPRLAARELGVPLRRWVSNLIFPLVVPTIVAAGVAWGARFLTAPLHGIVGALTAAGAVVLLASPGFWFLALDRETRTEIVRWVSSRLRKR